jgi:hypothetical protein
LIISIAHPAGLALHQTEHAKAAKEHEKACTKKEKAKTLTITIVSMIRKKLKLLLIKFSNLV